MSNISDKLIQLSNIKSDIKTAINNKGQSVGDDFSTYANAIDNITTGDGPVYQNPDFYELRTQGGTNYDRLFYYYDGPEIDVSNWDTSKVSSAQYCFSQCKNPINIGNWDLSSLTNAYHMFYYFTNNNTYIDLSVLDFSKANNVERMFGNSNTDYLDVRNINLTGATNYINLFESCSGTELDLSNWDINKVTSLYTTFSGSSHTKIDLTGWKTTNVTNFYRTFYGSSSHKLTHLIIPDWDMTNATNTSGFINTTYSKLIYIDLSRSNDVTINTIASLLKAQTATTYGDILVPADTSQDAINALVAKYWKPVGPKLDLISTELAFELDEIKPGKTTKVYNGNNNPWYGDDRLETIEFISSDESIATVNGNVITSTGVEGTVEISARNKETLAILGSATLTVSETDSKPNLIKFRTNGNEGTSNMLVVNGTNIKASQCTKDSITNIYSYDPGKQITSIKFSEYVNEIVKFNFNAANITDMENMFTNYQGTTLDISDWDTSNVTYTYQMFSGAVNLTTIAGVFDCSNLKLNSYKGPLGNAFISCKNLETLYLKDIFKNSTMANSAYWSINLGNTKVKDECLLYIINELPNLYDKGITNNTNIILTLPPTNTLTESDVAIAVSKGWICANCNF